MKYEASFRHAVPSGCGTAGWRLPAWAVATGPVYTGTCPAIAANCADAAAVAHHK